MKAIYKHTCIVARDWQKITRFYQEVFDCVLVPPIRDLSGTWLAKGTGVPDAQIRGVHLRMPGYGRKGPTLEIFQYSRNKTRPTAAANREGLAHLAFEVESVERATNLVLENGGKKMGEIATTSIDALGTLTFVYLADPEGNMIEVQAWNES
jgi:catechol 2,3-dioxygenase-like lactoylglutathione lyase family enzyme